jgi:hypothetical protein
MALAELELSAAPCHEPCHDRRQVRYDVRGLRVDSRRWVMSTTTRISPVSGVPARLADQGIPSSDCRPHPRRSPLSHSVSLTNPLADRRPRLRVPAPCWGILDAR